MSAIDLLQGLSVAAYRPHALHREGVVWAEKNCYADLWIETLHALGFEPLAMLPFTVAVDFEGDQWTFFKPPLEDLRELYGIDVQELTIWRPLLEHALEHLGAGKLIATEADAFWLPDTQGTDYQTRHTKTTILLTRIDAQTRRLAYLHNAGYFELSGDDFEHTLGLRRDAAELPLFAEQVRLDRCTELSATELAQRSWQLFERHFRRRPVDNPFLRFQTRFVRDLPELQNRGLSHYHAWAFATLRQAGSAYELLAEYLRWQSAFGRSSLPALAQSFDVIAQSNKVLILKAARAVNSRRALDATTLFADMADAWSNGMTALEPLLGSSKNPD